MESNQVPSAAWVMARVRAGRWLYGSDEIWELIDGPPRATSIMARYCIAGAAWSSSQPSGKLTGPVGGGGAGAGAGAGRGVSWVG